MERVIEFFKVKLGIPVKEDPTVVVSIMHTSWSCVYIFCVDLKFVCPFDYFFVQFPLLSLPKEIITYIYSFLLIKDRMRARSNKTLDAIDLNSNYSVKHMHIKEVGITIVITI